MLHSGGLMKISSALFHRTLQGKFQMMPWEQCLCRKDNTKVQTGDTHTIILALHQKVSNVIDLDIRSVKFSHSVMSWLFATPWTAARQASLSITNTQSLLKLMSIMSVMPSNHLILCHPFLLLPSIFPSIRVFSNESVLCIRWPKYWSFSFRISPSNEYSGWISFRIDWLEFLAV